MTNPPTKEQLQAYAELSSQFPRTLSGDVLVPASNVKAMATLALQSPPAPESRDS